MMESIIKHMEADEMRNIVMHLLDVDEARGQLIHAQSEIIDCLQSLYRSRIYLEESRIHFDCKMGSLRKAERILQEKYSEYLPVPVCEKMTL